MPASLGRPAGRRRRVADNRSMPRLSAFYGIVIWMYRPDHPLGEPLRDREYFCQASVDDEARTVVWPNGLDPAPELLYNCGEASGAGESMVQTAHA
jgi:hypothetical protein